MSAIWSLDHLHDLAADRSPDAAAFVVGDEVLTRAETVDRIARLAGALAALGVGRGDRVAVRWRTSVECHLAVAAVLRLGGVVVTLDPAAGDALAAATVAATGTEVLLAERGRDLVDGVRAAIVGTPGRAGAGSDGAVALADALAADPAGGARALGDDPAYVLTTSGSTGRPKLIVHTHRSGLRYAEMAAATYDLGPDDLVAHVPPLHFDQSTLAVFAAPLAGAAVAPVPDPVLRLPAELVRWLAATAPTVWYSVPTVLVTLLRRGGVDVTALSSLRWVLFGGEVFPNDALAELMAMTPDARWSNVYGPAEVNHCTHHHLEGPPAPGDVLPIGRAWDDTEVDLVDEEGRTVVGAGDGELLVRSATMMRGYWGSPELDERAFRWRPGPDGTPVRWYATGDLARRDDDGLLRFLGRRDRQVKVRGVRLELESVERAIAEACGAAGVAVVPVPDDDGLDALAALVVGADPVHGDEQRLRRSLAAVLPSAALPTRVVLVDELPLTGTGKIDRRRALDLIASEEP